MSLNSGIVLFFIILALLSSGMGAPWWFLPLFVIIIIAIFWGLSWLDSDPSEKSRK